MEYMLHSPVRKDVDIILCQKVLHHSSWSTKQVRPYCTESLHNLLWVLHCNKASFDQGDLSFIAAWYASQSIYLLNV